MYVRRWFLKRKMTYQDEEYGYSLMETTREEKEEDFKDAGHYPQRPLKLEVENLSYYVKDARTKAEIVIMDGVSCAFMPGEMTAIMGPSGAGKTTLLNVLSSRASGRVDGRVLLNGKKATAAGFKKMANYVPQDDDMLTSLTPRSQLEYVARLRTNLQGHDRDHRVNALLRQMRLENCADVTIVARDGSKGISGGQRKRVSIAMELVNEPSALFLDEPTSGLDSSMAAECVQALQRLARSPSRCLNVVCTIHQPSVDIFFTFDELLLLSSGRIVYHGAPRGAKGYFTNHIHILPGSSSSRDSSVDSAETTTTSGEASPSGRDWKNPAELVLDAISEAAPGLLADAWEDATKTLEWHSPRRKLTEARFADLGRQGSTNPSRHGTSEASPIDISEAVDRVLSAGFETAKDDDEEEEADSCSCCALCLVCNDNNKRRVRAWRRRRVLAALQRREMQYYDDSNDAYPISRIRQFGVLLHRAAADHIRSKMRIQLTVALGVGLLYGLVFRNLENTQDQYDMRLSALFMAVIYNGMMCVSQTSILVPLEKRVLLREYQNGYYAVFPFFASAILVRFCFQALATTVWAVPFYIMSGLTPQLERFVTLLVAVYMLAFIGLVYGFTIGTVAKSPQKAQQMLIPCIMPLIIFCGFLLQYDGVQIYFRPIWFASFFRYAFTILVVNEFSHGTFDKCDPSRDFCPLASYSDLPHVTTEQCEELLQQQQQLLPEEDDDAFGGGNFSFPNATDDYTILAASSQDLGSMSTSGILVDRKFVITEILDFDDDAIPKYFYILLIYAAGLATVAYYILRHQARKRYG